MRHVIVTFDKPVLGQDGSWYQGVAGIESNTDQSQDGIFVTTYSTGVEVYVPDSNVVGVVIVTDDILNSLVANNILT